MRWGNVSEVASLCLIPRVTPANAGVQTETHYLLFRYHLRGDDFEVVNPVM